MSNIENSTTTTSTTTVTEAIERFEVSDVPACSSPDSLYEDVAASNKAAPMITGTMIQGRWRPVMVEKILDMQVVDLEHFEEEKEVKLAGAFFRKEKNIRGMLKKAQLQVTVSLAEPIMSNQMSAHIATSYSVSSKNISVNIGTTQNADDIKGEKIYTVVVPIVDGMCDKLPLLDHIHSKGEHILHTCVRIPGINEDRLGVTHRIRLKVCDEFGTATITSSGIDLFNTARISEAAANFGDLVGAAKDAVISSMAACFYRIRRKTEPRSDAVAEGETDNGTFAPRTENQPQYIPVPVMMQMPPSGGNGDHTVQPIPVYMPQNFAPQYPVKPQAEANPAHGNEQESLLV